jgi:hypothetical protein
MAASPPERKPLISEALARFLMVPTYVFLVCARMPNVIHQGRFWAEEGTVFYSNARKLPWLEATFNSYAGYTNLAANLAGVLAFHCSDLKHAPYVSTGFAATIQTLPCILLCMSSEPWLKTWRIVAVALLIMLVQPAALEIWLSSIGSQCFLNLSVGLILMLQPESHIFKRLFQYLVLLMAPLSGPGGSFLLPFMTARAWIDRSKLRAFQAAVLLIGTLIQLVFFYHKSDRSMTAEWPLFLSAMFVKHLMVPALGRLESQDFCVQLYKAAHDGILPAYPSIAILAYLLAIAAMIFVSRARAAWWPFLSASLITPLAFFGSLGDRRGLLDVDGGNRYTYASQVLYEMSLLIIACTGQKKKISIAAKWLLTWFLIVGMHEYFTGNEMFLQGPEWRGEVRKWQANHDYIIRLWPATWPLKIERNANK